MSDLRIRSEAAREEIWPESFLPPQAHLATVSGDNDSDFGAFLATAGQALSLLFGLPVAVSPGRSPVAPASEVVPRVAQALAGLLATVRLGGDPARVGGEVFGVVQGGVALTRYAGAIAAALDAAAVRAWPEDCRLAGLSVDVSWGAVTGHAYVPAPPMLPRAAPVPVAALAVRVFDLPMRVRVEISSEMAAISALLPLRVGKVLPIGPVAEMPLVLGDHRVGRVSVAPMADGRQQATILAVGVVPGASSMAGERT